MKEIILNHLQSFGSITSLEAIEKYKCTRLSQYILLLRKDGYIIDNEEIPFTHSVIYSNNMCLFNVPSENYTYLDNYSGKKSIYPIV